MWISKTFSCCRWYWWHTWAVWRTLFSARQALLSTACLVDSSKHYCDDGFLWTPGALSDAYNKCSKNTSNCCYIKILVLEAVHFITGQIGLILFLWDGWSLISSSIACDLMIRYLLLFEALPVGLFWEIYGKMLPFSPVLYFSLHLCLLLLIFPSPLVRR